MKKAIFCLMAAVLVTTSFAQDVIEFEKSLHDFGMVKEENGAISYSFTFINAGKDPLTITGVNASCGCTTPAWTQEQVQPGDSGFITAQYNPLNRPGHFKKSLKVNYAVGGKNEQSVLYIEGNVKPKPKTIEDELPTQIGDLRLKYKSLNMGKITTEKPVIQTFDVYNESDSVWDWQPELSKLPPHISVAYEPAYLKPHEAGQIIVTYDPNKSGELGFRTDNIRLFTTETNEPEKELFVIATVEEYFPPMTAEELEKAPRLSFNKSTHDFGNVNGGSTVTTTFSLTNNGQEDLIIRQVKANCGCTVPKVKKEKIAPGKTVELEVSFDSSGRRGRQYKTVTVFSNDPIAPTQTLSLKADVVD